MNVKVAFAFGATSLWKQMRHRKQSRGQQRKDFDHKRRTCCSHWVRGRYFRQIENLISTLIFINCEPWLINLSEPPIPHLSDIRIYLMGLLWELIKIIPAQCLKHIKHLLNVSHFIVFRVSWNPAPHSLFCTFVHTFLRLSPNLHLLPKAAA